MPKSRRQQVWERAGGRCEYCHVAQEYDPRPFHLDHIRPRKHGGATVIENLALYCAACSLYKGANASGFDPPTDTLQRLFDPRVDYWSDHFEWTDAILHGKTEIGRATIEVLRINDRLRIEHQTLLIKLNVFPS
jgi:hypothetical protein